MERLWHDLRYGWRKLVRSPGFTLVAVLTLALGIGATTAIFTVVNAILLRPLPYEQPERLVLVWNRMVNTDFQKAPVAAPDVVDYREAAELFESFAATNNVNEAALTGEGEPEQIKMALVTDNFFHTLGVEPFLGRNFTPDDAAPFPPGVFQDPDVPIPPSAFIMSHGFWRRRFAGDPQVLGRTIRINGQPMTVVGVMPRDFKLYMPTDAGMPTDIDGWTPLRFDLSQGARDQQWLRVIGRLKPGVSPAQAQAEMDAIAARQREQHRFHANMGMHIVVKPMHADVVGHVRPVLLALLGAVAFVLLIACANVANLLLARATTRSREMAIRAALGAGRRRIVRQVLTEGALLALLGGTVGLLLARGGIELLLAMRPADLPRVGEIGIDGTVLAFALGTTLLAALLFGLAPAFAAAEGRIREALGERGADGGRRTRLRSGLVVAEVALSAVLLIGAGLMLRSFVALTSIDPGFEPAGVQTYNLQLPGLRYRTRDARTAFFLRVQERVGGLPGVEAVGASFPLPLSGRLWTGPYGTPGTDPETWTENEANYRVTTGGFFAAMGARLLSGRFLERADIEDRRNVVVVDDVMARRVWPDLATPVGQQLGLDLFGQQHWLEVVGVVERMRHESLTQDSRQTIYFPHHLFPFTQMYMTVRTSGSPAGLMGPIRRQIAELDPDLPVYNARPLQAYVDDAMANTRFSLALMAVFAAVALTLATVGLYGVISYAVRQRTQEIGIRMAFGAEARDILRLVVGRGAMLIGLGLALGLIGAFGVTRAVSGLLYGVAATDPLTFAGIAVLLAAVALAACWVPARQAARVDPMVSLRAE